MRIISARGRAIQAQRDAKRRLEEKFQLERLPLSKEEQVLIERIFDNIRRQLDTMGGVTCPMQS